MRASFETRWAEKARAVSIKRYLFAWSF